MFQAILMYAVLGQVCDYPTVVIGPPIYIELRICEGVSTRFDAPVCYGQNYRVVPVVNGFVPDICETKCSDGSMRIVYDYNRRIPYSHVVKPGMSQPQLPRSAPDPRPSPPIRDIPFKQRPPPAGDLVPVERPLKRPSDTSNEGLRRPSDVGSAPQQRITPTYRDSD